jgi:D-cysteine desulfhydrase
LALGESELFIKDDGALHPRYGGNKVRKLARILADARDHGSERVVTFGAAGSHHALTTALFAPDFGLRAAAILGPQVRTVHAEAVLRASLASGLEAVPVSNLALAPVALVRMLRRGDYVVGPGGSGLQGTLAYAEAVLELEQQIASGALPAPDVIVTAVGSGGTAAGILAGVVERGLAAQVLGVQVVGGHVSRALVLGLAARALRHRGRSLRGLSERFALTRVELGKGYGHATERGLAAREFAARHGLRVEPTYTEKALAHALGLANGARRVILYWHTLSAHEPRLEVAAGALAPEFAALLRG